MSFNRALNWVLLITQRDSSSPSLFPPFFLPVLILPLYCWVWFVFEREGFNWSVFVLSSASVRLPLFGYQSARQAAHCLCPLSPLCAEITIKRQCDCEGHTKIESNKAKSLLNSIYLSNSIKAGRWPARGHSCHLTSVQKCTVRFSNSFQWNGKKLIRTV